MKSILYFLTLILLVSCKTNNPQNEKKHFIEGDAPGVLNGMRVYMNRLNTGNKPMSIDTAIVMNEKFYFDKEKTFTIPEIRFLTMDTGEDRFVYIQGEESLDIKINQDTLWASKVIGSDENKILNEFRKSQTDYQKASYQFKEDRGVAYRSGDQAKGDEITKSWMNAEESYKNYVFEVIQQNPEKLVSSMIIGDLLNAKLVDNDKARELFGLLKGGVTESPISKSLETYLMKFEATAIGVKAPSFEGKTPDGSFLKLEDTMGKVTLIDFWASWCGPCRKENPNVVRAYKKYHNKGFNIVSVSLDKQNAEAAWKAAIEKDNMDWYHISRLMHWQDPIAQMYNVTSIPATFLIDENGIIIAKNLRGQALHDKLEELL